MKKIVFKFLIVMSVSIFGTSLMNNAFAVNYLPDVTEEMSNSKYWSEDSEILMTLDEINSLNTF